jgi:hypothetical protein
VIVVEEDRVDAHVLCLRLGLLVVAIADLANRRLAGLRVPVDLDRRELLDRLRLAVLGHLEVHLLQVTDRLRLLVGDDDVDADEVDAAAERGLWCLRLLALRGLIALLRRLALCLSARLVTLLGAARSRVVTLLRGSANGQTCGQDDRECGADVHGPRAAALQHVSLAFQALSR